MRAQSGHRAGGQREAAEGKQQEQNLIKQKEAIDAKVKHAADEQKQKQVLAAEAAAKLKRLEYRNKCIESARKVQAIWRGREGREQFRLAKIARLQRMAEEENASTRIQNIYRGRQARRG